MTSKKFQRQIRRLGEDLGLNFAGTSDGGQHVVMHFTAPGRLIQIPVPKGRVSEVGRLIPTIRSQVRSAARNSAIATVEGA